MYKKKIYNTIKFKFVYENKKTVIFKELILEQPYHTLYPVCTNFHKLNFRNLKFEKSYLQAFSAIFSIFNYPVNISPNTSTNFILFTSD